MPLRPAQIPTFRAPGGPAPGVPWWVGVGGHMLEDAGPTTRDTQHQGAERSRAGGWVGAFESSGSVLVDPHLPVSVVRSRGPLTM